MEINVRFLLEIVHLLNLSSVIATKGVPDFFIFKFNLSQVPALNEFLECLALLLGTRQNLKGMTRLSWSADKKFVWKIFFHHFDLLIFEEKEIIFYFASQI